ncbi:unnamed protein product [Brugia pahangi]|uniref:Uncharacterized protein n=1 Tax=Brugia pahangi TaxID=6280 RepID=A0A0N4TE18_BRUPA|nr:unnamed protein product [Brugia pahangi]
MSSLHQCCQNSQNPSTPMIESIQIQQFQFAGPSSGSGIPESSYNLHGGVETITSCSAAVKKFAKYKATLFRSVCKVKKYNFFSNISNPVAVPPQYPFGHENRNREYAGRIQNQYDKFGYKQLNGNKLKIKRTNSHMQMGKCPSKNSANMVTKYQRNEYREDGPSTNKVSRFYQSIILPIVSYSLKKNCIL